MTSFYFVGRIYGEKFTLMKIDELFNDEDVACEVAEQFGDCDENYLGLIGFLFSVMSADEAEYLAGRAFCDGAYYNEKENYVELYYRTDQSRGKKFWEELVKRVKGIEKVEAFADPDYPEDIEEIGDNMEVYE